MLSQVITDHGELERRITDKHYVIDFERMKWKAEQSLKFTDLHYTSSTHTDLVKYIRAAFRSKLEKMDAFQRLPDFGKFRRILDPLHKNNSIFYTIASPSYSDPNDCSYKKVVEYITAKDITTRNTVKVPDSRTSNYNRVIIAEDGTRVAIDWNNSE